MSFQAKFFVSSCLFPLMLLMGFSSHAATATLAISGSIGQVDQELQSYFSIGDLITGAMIVEERAGCGSAVIPPPGSLAISIPILCKYRNAVQSLSINVGAHSFVGSTPSANGSFFIQDDYPGGAFGDSFRLILATPTSNTTDFGAVEFNNISMSFEDSTGNALSSTALPLTPPGSFLFDLAEFRLAFLKLTPMGDGSVQFTSPSVIATNLQLTSVSAVPEPQTYALMLLGLGMVCFMVRRGKAGCNSSLSLTGRCT